MATQLPLRSIRIPAMQRQCLFLRHQHLNRPFAASASRTFSSTPSCAYRKKSPRMQDSAQTRAAAEQQTGPSPKVNFEKAQQDSSVMAEDIGLLQNTIVRAPFKDLPSPFSGKFWGYFWSLTKAKGTAFYARSYYRRCIQKKGWSQWLPVDVGKNAQLKDQARKFYEQLYVSFARGDLSTLKQICLPPLVQKFESRIAARGQLKMDWRLLKWKSARVVSHRASPLGEDHPDTAFRQAIIRLESQQILSMTREGSSGASKSSGIPKKLKWVPEEAQQKQVQQVQSEEVEPMENFADNGTPKKVVEYLVLQKRVIRGREEEWKVWGFAEETTPALLESDEAYWRRTLDTQVAGN